LDARGVSALAFAPHDDRKKFPEQVVLRSKFESIVIDAFEIEIGGKSVISIGWTYEFEVNVIAAFIAGWQIRSADDGNQVRKSMLIMRNAIETIGWSLFSSLENLRHKGAHQSAEKCLDQERGDGAQNCSLRDDSLLNPGTQISARDRETELRSWSLR